MLLRGAIGCSTGRTDRAQPHATPVAASASWAVRQRIKAIVIRNAPQVMVKVTGGGRGMAAIAAHLRYISKSGRLPFEDDRGEVREGAEALRDGRSVALLRRAHPRAERTA